MVHPHLISAILTEPWAISEESALAHSQLVLDIFENKISFEPGTPTLPSLHAVAFSSDDEESASADSESGVSTGKQIQVITISGPLMKNNQFCGPAGMKTMGQWIQDADRNPAVDGILLLIDSPGGTVSGTEELAAIIKGTKKPIIAFGEDLIASAGYWLASHADEIWANNTTAQFGSIGVLMSFMDIQPAMEKLGVKYHMITAPQSIDKTAMWEKLRKGDYAEYKEKVLKPIAAKFIDVVKLNRPGVTDDQLTGKIFYAQDVVGSLVDTIGTFHQALQRVAELADLQSNDTQHNEPNNSSSEQANNSTFQQLNASTSEYPTAIPNPPSITMSNPKLTRLAKAVDVEAFESTDGSITLTAEQAVAAETALETAETALNTAESSRASLQSQLDATAPNTARIADLEGQLQTANARITELSKEAGAESAAVIIENDGTGIDAETDNFHTRLTNLIPLTHK